MDPKIKKHTNAALLAVKCIKNEHIKAPVQIITYHVLVFVSVKKFSPTVEQHKAQHLKTVQKVYMIYLVHSKPSGLVQNTMKTQIKLHISLLFAVLLTH